MAQQPFTAFVFAGGDSLAGLAQHQELAGQRRLAAACDTNATP
jgi:hypothetical protein